MKGKKFRKICPGNGILDLTFKQIKFKVSMYKQENAYDKTWKMLLNKKINAKAKLYLISVFRKTQVFDETKYCIIDFSNNRNHKKNVLAEKPTAGRKVARR